MIPCTPNAGGPNAGTQREGLLALPRALHLAALLVLGALASCSQPPPNVVLVIGDTLRADRLGTYGNPRGLTPFLDELAEEALVFENASNHAPWTLPSTASLLTSMLPEEHGAGGRLGAFRKLDDRIETLAELLQARGYATHAVVNVIFLSEGFGLTQGFDSVDAEVPVDNKTIRSARVTTDSALAWLDREELPEPFFLLVHYFDPHAVYAPPQPFRRRFALPLDQDDESWVFGTREQMLQLRGGQLDVSDGVIRRAEKLYDAEVAYLDAELGRLFDQLEARGLDDRTVLAFTADHGEEFLDHGGFEHGHTLYPELTHVPLLLRAPDLGAGRVSQSVGHVDVAPTVLQLLDVPAPEHYVGRSLLEFAEDPAAPHRAVLAHGNFWARPLSSWRSGDLALLLDADGGAELYRWTEDPRYERDLAAELPEEVERLRTELQAVRLAMRQKDGQSVDLSDEQAELLRTLGYIGDEDPDSGG